MKIVNWLDLALPRDVTERAYQVSSGIYILNNLGLRVKERVIKVIDNAYQSYTKVELPSLQPLQLWEQSGRANSYGQEMFKVDAYCLSPTAEELAVFLFKKQFEAKDIRGDNYLLYQITNKYRNELRPQGGLIRTKEFCMFDGYSFSYLNKDSQELYERNISLYQKIFNTLGINVEIKEAETGEVGGTISHEFIDTATGIEVGHIFQLGTKYTEKVGLPHFMNCYGIGVSRLITLAKIKPFDYVITDVRNKTKNDDSLIDDIFDNVDFKDTDSILFDDRDVSAGCKFYDAELLADKYIVVGDKDFELRIS